MTRSVVEGRGEVAEVVGRDRHGRAARAGAPSAPRSRRSDSRMASRSDSASRSRRSEPCWANAAAALSRPGRAGPRAAASSPSAASRSSSNSSDCPASARLTLPPDACRQARAPRLRPCPARYQHARDVRLRRAARIAGGGSATGSSAGACPHRPTPGSMIAADGGSSSVFSSASCASHGHVVRRIDDEDAARGLERTIVDRLEHALAQRPDLDRRFVAADRRTVTSECCPRAIRWQVGARRRTRRRLCWRGQFTACASAMATARLPTPSGPAKSRLCGTRSADTAWRSSAMSGAWPTMSESGTRRSYRAPRAVAPLARPVP